MSFRLPVVVSRSPYNNQLNFRTHKILYHTDFGHMALSTLYHCKPLVVGDDGGDSDLGARKMC
jgi:hypothetical protein